MADPDVVDLYPVDRVGPQTPRRMILLPVLVGITLLAVVVAVVSVWPMAAWFFGFAAGILGRNRR